GRSEARHSTDRDQDHRRQRNAKGHHANSPLKRGPWLPCSRGLRRIGGMRPPDLYNRSRRIAICAARIDDGSVLALGRLHRPPKRGHMPLKRPHGSDAKMEKGIFDGLKVLDCASFIAAPAAATVLSDFGADVIKIEPPGSGDPYRNLPNLPGYPHSEH